MSGHSKWAQIKRQKGIADIKRGQAFTKVANAITIAVKQGGGVTDPNQNYRLRLEIEKARALNMPKSNIERATERGKGKNEKGDLEEIVYEGFGPCGIAVIVEVATDNKLRTAPEIKNIFDKAGGMITSLGSVSYQFKTMGQIIVKKQQLSYDEIFLSAADLGALDAEEVGEEVYIYTKAEDLARIKDYIKNKTEVVSFELIKKPTVVVPIGNKEDAKKVLDFMEKLENHEDVQKVFSNFEIPDEILL